MSEFDLKAKYEYIFNLTSTVDEIYPIYKSNKYIQGRKCIEFSWENGTNNFVVGFRDERYHIYLYGDGGDAQFRITNDNNYSSFSIESIAQNERYMMCVDTIRHDFLLINKTYKRKFTYPDRFKRHLRVYFQCGAAGKWDYVHAWFKKPFVNSMPASFVPIASNMLYENPSCNIRKRQSNTMFLCVIICLLLK